MLVSDFLPQEVTFVSATPSQGTCTGTITITCELGTINNGANAEIEILVDTRAKGTLKNTASVTSAVTDPNSNNNSVMQSTTVNPAADLAIEKEADKDPVLIDSELTYTLTVMNNGPDEATNVEVTDILPSNVSFVLSNASQGTCNGTSTVTCNLGMIESRGNATVEIMVVTPDTVSNITNKSSVTSGTPRSGCQEQRGGNNYFGPDECRGPCPH